MSSKYIWVLALLLVGCQTIPTSTNNKTNGSETAQTVSESSTVVKAQSTTSKKPKSAVKPPLVELTPQQQENLWLRIAMQFKLEVPDDPSVDYYRIGI